VAPIAAPRIAPLRWSYSLVGGSGFALAAVGVLTSVFADSVELKTFFLAVGCFGIHLHAGAWWGVNSIIGGPHSGTTFAFINTAGVFTGATAQVGFGAIPREHWGNSFLICATLLAIGSVCWYFVDPNKTIADRDA